MYFVIQVMSTNEQKMMDHFKKDMDTLYYSDMFIPLRVRMKKKQNKWIEVEERVFPGYIFVETSTPKEFARELRKIDGFKRLVGFGSTGGIHYTPLSKKNEEMIRKLIGNGNHRIELSSIQIEEGKKIKVVDGPLLGFEGIVTRYNLHKRVALVDIDLNGMVVSVQLGIEVLKNK